MSSTRKRGQSTSVKSVGKKRTTANTAKKAPVKRKRHMCTLCSKDFDKRDRLQRHMDKHMIEEKQLSCMLCNITFKKKPDYEAHLEEHIPKSRVKCPVCKKWFDSQNLLEQHNKTHLKTHTSRMGRIECKECQSSFVSQKTLITHMRKFHFLLKCPDCEEYFTQMAGLKAHQNACHSLKWIVGGHSIKKEPGEDTHINLVCIFCDKQLQDEAALMSHMTLFHKGLKCSKCDNWCQGKTALINHLKKCKKQPNIKYFSCHICSKQFAKIETLVSHIKPCHINNESKKKILTNHKGQGPRANKCESLFKCQICDKYFATKVSLTGHLGSCISKFKCSICKKAFSTAQGLSSHVRIFHTGEKPYQCRECEKRFPHSNILQVHIAMVHQPDNADPVRGMKPFVRKKTHKCRVCRKGFFQASFLKMHMKIHSEEKKLMCGICGEKFSSEKAVVEHINIFHLSDKDRGNIQNQEYIVECVNTNGESWNEGDLNSNTNYEGEQSQKQDGCRNIGNALDEANSGNFASEQRCNPCVSTLSLGDSRDGVNTGKDTKTAGELYSALESLVARHPVEKSLKEDIPHTANSSGAGDDQLHLFTNCLSKNHLPNSSHAIAVTIHSQGEQEQSYLQYSHNTSQDGMNCHVTQGQGQCRVNLDSDIGESDKRYESQNGIVEQNSREMESEGSILASKDMDCDDEDYYIVVNTDPDEEEEEGFDEWNNVKHEEGAPCAESDHQPQPSQTGLPVTSDHPVKQEKQTFYTVPQAGAHDARVRRVEVIENDVTAETFTVKIEDSSLSNIHSAQKPCNLGVEEKSVLERNLETSRDSDVGVRYGQDRGVSSSSQKFLSNRSQVQHICGICQQGFLKWEDLHQHKVTSHSLQCTQCGQEYLRMIDLVTHYESCMR